MTAIWLRKGTCLIVACSFVLLGPMTNVARAELISTETVLQEDARDRVRALLVRDDVVAELESFGVSADEALARVDALSDAELAAIAGQIDELPAGGTSWLLIVAIVVVALAITDYFGVTNIYPWIDERDSGR